jgi:hypothetical protein
MDFIEFIFNIINLYFIFMKRVPTVCPSCDKDIHVRNIRCGTCGTEITGDYAFPPLARLSLPDQDFIRLFVLSSGSLKEMARRLQLSYPTVRNRLDEIITRIQQLEGNTQ